MKMPLTAIVSRAPLARFLHEQALHALRAFDGAHRRVPLEADLPVGAGALLERGGRAQGVAAVDHRHLRGVLGEMGRFVHRGVAPAHHRHGLIHEERAVAGRAVRDPLPTNSSSPGTFRVAKREPEATMRARGA
jgi:hypothetical protein